MFALFASNANALEMSPLGGLFVIAMFIVGVVKGLIAWLDG